MEPPKNTEIIESPASTSWFDENGILCSITKKTEPQTLEQTKTAVEDFKKRLNGKKVCLLIDSTHSSESSKEVRDYVAMEFPKFVTAMAVISSSELGKMLANL